MGHTTKIATCCYCGTRAALVLKGEERHELACSGCGAPLHDLKALRPAVARTGPRELVRPSRPRHTIDAPKKRRKSKKSKKKNWKRSRFGGFLVEAFDVIEDIFD
jgi:ribosomal protein L34E